MQEKEKNIVGKRNFSSALIQVVRCAEQDVIMASGENEVNDVLLDDIFAPLIVI